MESHEGKRIKGRGNNTGKEKIYGPIKVTLIAGISMLK